MVRVLHIDTRSPFAGLRGTPRTWVGSRPDLRITHIRQNYDAVNVRNERHHYVITALMNAVQCKELGWTYDYVVSEPPANRHPSWIKLWYVLGHWDEFKEDEFVVVMDTDAWIRDADGFSRLLEDAEKDLILVEDTPCAESVEHRASDINGGFMCFKPTAENREFFQSVWDLPDVENSLRRYAGEWPWEQKCLNHLLEDARRLGDIVPVTACNTPAGTLVTHCWWKDIAHDLCAEDLFSMLAAKVFPQSQTSVEIVVARHGEDVAWVYEFAPYVDKITVYDKSPADKKITKSSTSKVSFVDSENVGREAHAYLSHIVDNYESLSGNVIFTQANFVDHMPRSQFVDLLRGDPRPTNNGLDCTWSSTVMDTHKWTPTDNYAPDQEMKPAGMTLGKFFMKFISEDLVPESDIKWWQNAIFTVPADRIRAVPLERYQTLLGMLEAHTNPELAHYMERFWYALFELKETPEETAAV